MDPLLDAPRSPKGNDAPGDQRDPSHGDAAGKPRRRRILVLNERDPRNPRTGGAETHVFELFSRLAARGHEVTLLAARFPGGAREEVVQGVRVKRLASRYLYWLLVPWAARREAARGCDVVVDVLNKLPFFSPWFVPKPCFAIVHHLLGHTAFQQVPFPVALASWLLEKLVPAAYARTPMLAISPSTKADLVQRGLDAGRIHVVPPGMDLEAHHPLDDGVERPPVVLWVGRLEPYKRADVLLEAMPEVLRAVPGVTLVVVGEGSQRAALEARTASGLLAGRVRFAGFVSEHEKIAWLRRASVLVQSSEKEGWGMTVIEANACNTVVVASNVEGLRDSVRHDETGLLVPFGDPRALAAALVRTLEDRALRRRLLEGGLAWARHFGWEEVADDAEQLVEHAVAPGAARPRLSAWPFEGTAEAPESLP